MGDSPAVKMILGTGPLIPIPALAQADQTAPPEEFRVWPLGWVELLDGGSILVDEAALQAVVAAQAATGYDLVIDYHHQATPEISPDNPYLRPDRQAPAAGWCQLAARPDGLWAVGVRWTPDAAKAVAERAFRYISPAFYYDKETKGLRAIIALSLTNRPLTRAAEPLVAHLTAGGDSMDKFKEFLGKLAQAWGLKGELSEDKAVELAQGAAKAGQLMAKTAEAAGLKPEEMDKLPAKVAEIKAAKPTGGGDGLLAKVAQALGLAATAGEAEVLGAAQAKAAGSETAAKLAERLAKVETDLAAKAAQELVAQALKDGKIVAAQAEWLKSLAAKDLAQAEAFVRASVKVVPVGQGPTTPPAPQGELAGLTAEDVAVARLMGTDLKALAAQAKAEKEA